MPPFGKDVGDFGRRALKIIGNHVRRAVPILLNPGKPEAEVSKQGGPEKPKARRHTARLFFENVVVWAAVLWTKSM